MLPLRIASHFELFLIPLLSFAALMLALVSQYFYGLHPCELCEYQRIPYLLAAGLGLWVIILSRKKNINRRARAIFLFSYLLLMIVETSLAFYHFAVEKGYVKGITACTSSGPAANTKEEMLNKIMAAPIISCNQPQFEFLHISMAGWNGFYSLILVILSLFLIVRRNNVTG